MKLTTDAGWVRDSEGKNTGDWEVVIYVDDEPVGRILAYPSLSYVHDVAPNIRVAIREFDKLIRCEPEDNWVHWVFRSDGPWGPYQLRVRDTGRSYKSRYTPQQPYITDAE
jgi:hypothetical protein